MDLIDKISQELPPDVEFVNQERLIKKIVKTIKNPENEDNDA